jgi:hypothetical protein
MKPDVDLEMGTTSSTCRSRASSDESGPSQPFNGDSQPRTVWCNLSVAQRKSFADTYGFVPASQGGPPHQHPHSHYQRCWLERRAHKLARKDATVDGAVIEVGAAPARVLRHHGTYCLCPILQPGDQERISGFKGDQRVCNCTLEQFLSGAPCKNGRAHPQPRTFIFTHSAYYMSEETLFEAMHQATLGCIYVVGHEFPEAFGYLNGYSLTGLKVNEIKYWYEGTDVISKVVGNHHHYRHPPLPWDHGRVPGTDSVSMDVQTLITLGHTKLWCIRMLPIPSPPQPSSDYISAIDDNKQHGEIFVNDQVKGNMQKMSSLSQLSLKLQRFHGFGPIVWVGETEEVSVTVPRGAVATVARKMIGVERTPAAYKDAVFHAKAFFHNAPMPAERILPAQIITAVLAMGYAVELEARLLQHSTTNFSRLWRVHAQLLMLVPARVLDIRTVLIVVLVGGVLELGLWVAVPEYHHIAALLTGGVVLTLGLALIFNYCYARYLSQAQGAAWSQRLLANQATSSVDSHAYPTVTKYPGTTLIKPLLEEHREGGSMVVGDDPNPPKHPGVPTTRFFHEGVVLDKWSVSVPEPTQAAEASAVSNRVLAPKLTLDKELIKLYALTGTLPEMDCHWNPGNRNELFNTWVERYPYRMREGLRRAYNQYRAHGLSKSDFYRDSFIKMELYHKVSRDGLDLIKPRLIQGGSDKLKVAQGPLTLDYARAVAKHWDGTHSRIFYVRGVSAEETGERVQAFTNKVGTFRALMSDLAAFDSTVTSETRSVVKKKHEPVLSQKEMEALHGVITAGSTRHGVKYADDEQQINSGDGGTNVDGTEINAHAHVTYLIDAVRDDPDTATLESGLTEAQLVYLAAKSLFADYEWLLLVCGDDALLLMDERLASKFNIERYEEVFNGLGLRPTPELHDDLAKVEFCSKLFWPVSEGGRNTIVLGPKPGRIIERIGYSIAQPNALNLAAKYAQLSTDCAHVPLASQFLHNTRRLVTGKARGTLDKYEAEFMVRATRKHAISDVTWSFFQRRYDVEKREVLEWTDSLMQITSIPAVVATPPWMARVIELDTGRQPE